MDGLLPWQQVTVGCGLMLSAASRVQLDADELDRQVQAAIDCVPDRQRNRYGNPDGDWTAITLLYRDVRWQAVACPPLDHMPALTDMLAREGLTPFGLHITRQPPGTTLPWHFDHQALHLPVCRLLLPIRVPDDAFTWIGHEKVAYAAGTLWTGDFALPHQVENPTAQERVVIAIDCNVTPEIQALFPADLWSDAPRRRQLAHDSINLMRASRTA